MRQKGSVAEAVAQIADVAGEKEIDAAIYFDVVDRGLYLWEQEERRHASLPDRSGGLSDTQKEILGIAFALMRRYARMRRRIAVVATTAHVETLLANAARTARAKDIFLGWKHRIGAADGTRPFQPVQASNGEMFIVVVEVVGSAGRRVIRVDVARGRKNHGQAWRLGLVLPHDAEPEELHPITEAQSPPPGDPVLTAQAQALYEGFKEKDRAKARSFAAWCADKDLRIRLWIQDALRRERAANVRYGDLTITELVQGTTVLKGGTGGADAQIPSRADSSAEEYTRELEDLEGVRARHARRPDDLLDDADDLTEEP